MLNNFILNILQMKLEPMDIGVSNPKAYTWILILIFAIVLAIFVFNFAKKKKIIKVSSKFPYKQFRAVFGSKGFSKKEIDLLFDYVDHIPISSPVTLVQSQHAFESYLNRVMNLIENDSFYQTNVEKEHAKNIVYKMMGKIPNLFKNIKKEVNTKDIKEGKKVRIFIKTLGYFYTEVLINNQDGLVLSKPDNILIKTEKKPITIFFFKDNDAGYSVDTYIEKEVVETHIKGIYISHSSNALRYQKRKYVRKKAKFYCNFSFATMEMINGYKKYVADNQEYDGNTYEISAGGLSLRTKIKSRARKIVKLQIYMGRESVNSICRIIRVEKTDDEYMYHLKFIKMKIRDQNRVYNFVYTKKHSKRPI